MAPTAPDADAPATAAPVSAAPVETGVEEPAAYASPSADGSMLRATREAQVELATRIHRLLAIVVTGGILYTCYFARELILPILLAAFFALLLGPLLRRLVRPWLPRWIVGPKSCSGATQSESATKRELVPVTLACALPKRTAVALTTG